MIRRRIYLVFHSVNEQDFHTWSIIRVFTSKEDAKRFIIEAQEAYLEDEERIRELEHKMRGTLDLTDDEMTEYYDLREKWADITYRDGPEREWRIKQIFLQE